MPRGIFERTKKHSEKMGLYLKGKTYEEVFGVKRALEIKKKLSKAKIGYTKGFQKGHQYSGFKGKNHSEETRKKIGLAQSGDKHWNWNNGSSFEPYGTEFNRGLKEQIRKRDNYRCQECFRHQDELYSRNGQKYSLIVHHIDYNKQNNNPGNLISLCRSCHSQTNYKRIDWTNYFKSKLITTN